MFVVTRRSALPHLSLVSGAVVRLHADRLTLWPVSTTQKIELSVEPLPDGGYGILATTDSHATLLARYPAQRHAQYQLHRLTGVGEWHWRRLLGRAVLGSGVLFLVWFLFFVPVEQPPWPDRMQPIDPPGTPPVGAADPASNAMSTPAPTAAPPDDGPAFVDDPVERLQSVPAAAPAPE